MNVDFYVGKTDECMKAGDGRSEGKKGQPSKSFNKREKRECSKRKGLRQRASAKGKKECQQKKNTPSKSVKRRKTVRQRAPVKDFASKKFQQYFSLSGEVLEHGLKKEIDAQHLKHFIW